ncbi:ABC transporter substrate-binding protein [Rhodococcoides kyotonense]|uniref:Peptide/nickel transport system substrate-binding protein n=1 Tax=Rhodococcoides kyotonense TaxID=398843 RepID=A0A239GBR1_9NOCA|nr:ABC transporter substrate-binding protein [Rhodococcus kyotonensis]SNS66607.1 peptide/nickel transport system substrate-binding protein [Rhodococcus kyotonensis]
MTLRRFRTSMSGRQSTPRPSRRRGIHLLFTAVTATSLLLTGCAASTVASPNDDADAGEPVSGGTLKFALLDAPANLDPHSGGSYPESLITSNTADKLTYQNPETGAIEPWLAKSWEINDDLTEFTFHLRDDVTFNDGTKFDANSVVENFDILGRGNEALNIPAVTAYWVGYQNTVALDPYTAKVTFDRPSAGFLQALSHYFSGIVGHSTLQLNKADRALPQNIVTTGPFTVTEHVYQQKTVLTKREGYNWAPASRKHNGDAYLDTVEIDVIPEASVRTGALQSGDVDAILDVNSTDEQPLTAAGYRIVPQLIPGRDIAFDFKTDQFPTNDQSVREAIKLGWSRDALQKTVLTDSYKISSSVLSERVPGWKDCSSDLTEDQEKAKQILDDAGWKEGSDGIREKDGQKLTVKLLGINNLVINKPAYELIQQNLKEVGIDLQLNVLPIPDYTAASKQQNTWNITAANTSRGDVSVLEQTYSPLYTNASRIQKDNPIYQEAVDTLAAVSATLDPDKRAEASATAQDFLLNKYVLSVPVYNPAQVTAVSPSVHNVEYEAQSRNVFYDTWLDPR